MICRCCNFVPGNITQSDEINNVQQKMLDNR